MSPRSKEQNQAIREQTRQQILDAAFELFAEEGFSKTSIAAVAKKAEVSKGLIYHYFDSKERILESLFDQLMEMAEEMMTFPEGYTSSEKLRSVIEDSFHFIEHQSNLGRLMIGLALQRDAFETLKPKIDQVTGAQFELFAVVLKDAGFEKPRIEAYKLGAMLDGILMDYVALGQEYPLNDIKQKILDDYVPN
jgi:AcrR family transcriptional regulator